LKKWKGRANSQSEKGGWGVGTISPKKDRAQEGRGPYKKIRDKDYLWGWSHKLSQGGQTTSRRR